MLHGVSLIHVDQSAVQEAISNKAAPDTIVHLKASVAFNCVYGFEYYEVPFEDLANLLVSDVGFNNFKFKEFSKATYNKEKHPHAYGRVRGVANIESGCSWVWFDIDVTTISDTEMHTILSNVNHHIARTADPSKALKYRVLIELDKEVKVTKEEWKPFIASLAKYLNLGKIDKLAASQVIFGYSAYKQATREVLSVTDKSAIDPMPHLQAARAEVARRIEEEALYDVSPDIASKALQNPYSTFEYAYSAPVGDRWKTSMAAIAHAKRLGASKEYIQDLMYAINDFLDVPKSREVVRTSLFSAI